MNENQTGATSPSDGTPQTPETQAAKPSRKETALKGDKRAQIVRRISAIGFRHESDGRYVNSNPVANIQEIAFGMDWIDNNWAWLRATARKPFAYAAAASERFAQSEQARFECDLRLAKRYWLQTIHPFIKERPLRGAELFVATAAFFHLRKTQDNAALWKRTEHGQRCPVPAESLVDWNKEEFHEPLELCRDEKLTPELLAAIAAPMMQTRTAELPPLAVVGAAHDLLRTAREYFNALPEHKRGTERLMEAFETAFSTITFAEIAASNRKDSGQLPLLPPIGLKSKSRPEQEMVEKPLSVAAIREAVRRHLDKHTPRMTQEQFERDQEQTERLHKEGKLFRLTPPQPRTYQQWQNDNQNAIDDCMENSRVSLQDLCNLRWERFAENSDTRQRAAVKREEKKRQERGENRPLSATTSPTTAGEPERPTR